VRSRNADRLERLAGGVGVAKRLLGSELAADDRLGRYSELLGAECDEQLDHQRVRRAQRRIVQRFKVVTSPGECCPNGSLGRGGVLGDHFIGAEVGAGRPDGLLDINPGRHRAEQVPHGQRAIGADQVGQAGPGSRQVQLGPPRPALHPSNRSVKCPRRDAHIVCLHFSCPVRRSAASFVPSPSGRGLG